MKSNKIILALLILSMIALISAGCGGGGTTPPINHSPTITSLTANPQSPIEINQNMVITCSASDSDGDPLAYTWTKTGGTITGTGSAITWIAPDIEGTYTITCTASDGRGGEVNDSVSIVVLESEPISMLSISVDSEYHDNTTGKAYVKGGSHDIFITFSSTVNYPIVKVDNEFIPVFTNDSLVWAGTYNFTGDCNAVLITVEIEGVEDLVAAKSVVVDSGNPYAELKATFQEDFCNAGYSLTISSDYYNPGYIPGCCGDDCSGLAWWNVEIYNEVPWGDYCAEGFYAEPIAQIDGTTCPITITTECIDLIYVQSEGWVDFFDKNYWVVATLIDNVGNEITYYGFVETDGYADEIVRFVELSINPSSLNCWCFAEDPEFADLVVGDCDGTVANTCWQ